MVATHPFLTFKDDIPRNPLFLLRKHFDLAFLQDGERRHYRGERGTENQKDLPNRVSVLTFYCQELEFDLFMCL